ncbi:GDSL esterase/lipase At5g45910-like [Neltuma alba]|uniref:GDSL esterase/lipase At5g45910-like n=1 Tax=Neltuma alba TaxID=207710 RepID=UPI0010A39ED8|nr:GDSL esterase/lipase At5g45910-like [Prosopis alba]XP_028787654.1 GDSL esterase/lipase At5g45910-like [Prosopis alba]
MKILVPLMIMFFIVLGFSEEVGSNPSDSDHPYEAIFNFGDSLSDTGNFLSSGALAFPVIGKFPYGETFFRHATGRCSDGRLIVDFIAEAYGLPYLTPYLKLRKGQDGHHGVNFAVAGATALDADFFYKRGLGKILWTHDSLSVQLDWFKKIKRSLCTTRQDCDRYLKRSLFLVGEIGGNDYNYAAFAGGNINQLLATVPAVVGAITNVTSELIAEGAVELVVPGNLPVGCSPLYMTLFMSQNNEDFDKNGCLKNFNAFAQFHNKQLNLALDTLRKKNPQVRIIYADYYGAAKRFIHKPQHFGFTGETLLRACCGGGGPFNFNNSARCGHIGSKACTDPSIYANWDGIHLTEAAYRHIATALIEGRFSHPPLRSSPFKIA